MNLPNEKKPVDRSLRSMKKAHYYQTRAMELRGRRALLAELRMIRRNRGRQQVTPTHALSISGLATDPSAAPTRRTRKPKARAR